MKTKPAAKAATMRDLTLRDMKRFHMSVDWSDWWQSFYLDISPSGTYKWRNLRQFAKDRARNDKQLDFIMYVCGPLTPTTYVSEDFKFAKPMDWEEKRKTGGWFTPENLRVVTNEIRIKADGLEALRSSGAAVTINSLIRVERMAQQIDREFGGQFMAAGLSFKENKARAELYVDLQRKILLMHEMAQDLYAKSHGINLQMDSLAQIVAGAAMTAQLGAGNSPQHKSRGEKVISAIIDMTLEKSATHAIPLPPEMSKKVVDVAEKIKVQ